MPLILITYAFIRDRVDLQNALRVIVATSWIPGCVGIVEWILCTMFGFRPTMLMIYGSPASAATQGFQSFNYGITLFRIPSTFTFAAQYSTYLWVALLASFILSYLDSKAHWRKFAVCTLCMVITASFLSGARGAFFFIPLLLFLSFSFQRGMPAALGILSLTMLIFMPAGYLIGFDLQALYSNVGQLLGHYSEASLQTEFSKAVDMAPFGLGTGMNTVAARYACAGAASCKIAFCKSQSLSPFPSHLPPLFFSRYR